MVAQGTILFGLSGSRVVGFLVVALLPASLGCTEAARTKSRARAVAAALRPSPARPTQPPSPKPSRARKRSRDYFLVHIFVALCDNKHQGIVPVPAFLGNGQNPRSNLYWGAAYGVRSWFRSRRGWETLKVLDRPRFPILERIVRRKRVGNRTLVLIADAYDGAQIMRAIRDALTAAAGGHTVEITVKASVPGERRLRIQAGGYADLVAYVGHNGLMDHPLGQTPTRLHDEAPKDAVILACASARYFRGPLARAGVRPLVWTTGLMAPEAYTLEAILEGKLRGRSPATIRNLAAAAYHRYQRCGLKAARRLFGGG